MPVRWDAVERRHNCGKRTRKDQRWSRNLYKTAMLPSFHAKFYLKLRLEANSCSKFSPLSRLLSSEALLDRIEHEGSRFGQGFQVGPAFHLGIQRSFVGVSDPSKMSQFTSSSSAVVPFGIAMLAHF